MSLPSLALLNLTQFVLPEIPEAFIFSWGPLTVYPLLLGLGLKKYIVPADKETDSDFKIFKIFFCLWMVFFLGMEVLNSLMDFEENRTDMLLPRIIIAIIGVSVLFKFVQFPSRTINSIELKREAGLWEYVADAFQILFWPLCIWWIQPRINRINDKKMKTG